MKKRIIANQYITYLQSGDIPGVLSLFSQDAIVHSPLYGTQSAAKFYEALSNDTANSELKILGIFEDPNSYQLALYFNYKWTLADDSSVDFDVVDILKFNDEYKITSLKIIYDTVHSRKALNDMKE